MFTIPFSHWPHLISITLFQPTNSHQRLRHKVPCHEHQISLSHQPSDILGGPKRAPSRWVVIGASLLINIKILHAADFQAIIHLGQGQLHGKGYTIQACWESWLPVWVVLNDSPRKTSKIYANVDVFFLEYIAIFASYSSLLSFLCLVTYSFTNMPSFCSRMLSPS